MGRRADAPPPRPRAAPAAGHSLPAAATVPLHHMLSQVPAGPTGPRTTLTEAEKRQFYRDGFLILRGVIPRPLTERARKAWNTARGRDRRGMGKSAVMTDLINASCVGTLLRNEMGPYTPPAGCQVAVTPPSKYRSADEMPGSRGAWWNAWPEYGNPGLHMDGLWTGQIPQKQADLDAVTGKPRDVAKYFGDESAEVLGGFNMVPLWMDRARTLSIGSFTTFVFVAINNQTELGRGQTNVLTGAHHVAQAYFRMQRDRGGPVGPEGPGWPRLAPVGKDGVMINYMPKGMRDHFKGKGAREVGGWTWPKPTPVLMEEGDCCITLHACPHGASQNFGPDPRMNVIFRIRGARDGDPNEGLAEGHDHDHPDRKHFSHGKGKFFEYPPGYDPFKISVAALCDHWSEWRGMRHVVAEERAKEAAARRGKL